MAYVKNIWVDQDVERPKTYEVTNNQDGSITLTDSFGLVTELGTPVNEVNMNHIEEGIDGCAIRKHNLTETFNLGEWVLGGTGDDEGIYKSLIDNNVGNAITDDTKWEKVELGGGASRNVGEIVTSTIPLTDAGLHLLDGALISGSGSYSAFVEAIAQKYQDSDKVSNVALVGSITEDNGILSNMSANGYAVITTDFAPSSNPWIFDFGFYVETAPTGNTGIAGIVNDKALNCYIPANSSNISIELSSNNSTFDIGTLTTSGLALNTWYRIKLEFTGNAYNLYSSTDGATYELQSTISSSTPIYQSGYNFNFGRDYLLGGASIGVKFDLNNSYIDINGSRFWTGSIPEWATDESSWQVSVTNYGVCGKYVYDSVNNTVRLPKKSSKNVHLIASGNKWNVYSDGFCEQWGYYTIGTDGNGTVTFPVGWKDTTYSFVMDISMRGDHTAWVSFPRPTRTTTTQNIGSSLTGYTINGYWMAFGYVDVSQFKDETIYEYVVLANQTKTAIEVDIDQIATDLNGKLDKDISNITNDAIHKITKYGCVTNHGYCSKGYTIGASGTSYVMAFDGWLQFLACAPAGGVDYSSYIRLQNLTSGNDLANYSTYDIAQSLFMPVQKGDTVRVIYGNNAITQYGYLTLWSFVGNEDEADSRS